MRFKGDLGKDEIGGLLLALSLPAMIGMTVQALYNVVDTFWVGKLGPEAIAALSICFPIQMLMIAVATGTGIGLTSIISRRLGENPDSEAVNAAEHGIMLVLFYGVLVTILGLIYAGPLLHTFGATPELFDSSKDYIKIILLGSILMFFGILSGSIIQAEGNAGTPMKSMLSGAITNIILDPFLIFGIGPFPEMGIQGAAIATLIGQLAACSINFRYIFGRQGQLILSLRNFKLSFYILGEIYKVGLPSMVMQLVNSLIMVVLNRILGSYGYLAIGALGVFFRVQSLIFMPVIGLTHGLTPIVGFAYGARRLDRMKEAIKKASLVSFIIMSIGFLAFQLIPGQVVAAFNNDPLLIELGKECMRNISILMPFVGPSIIMISSFQAAGKGFTALWLSLLRQLVFLLPAIFILSSILDLRGVWLAFPASDFLAISITALILKKYLNDLERNGFPQRNNISDTQGIL